MPQSPPTAWLLLNLYHENQSLAPPVKEALLAALDDPTFSPNDPWPSDGWVVDMLFKDSGTINFVHLNYLKKAEKNVAHPLRLENEDIAKKVVDRGLDPFAMSPQHPEKNKSSFWARALKASYQELCIETLKHPGAPSAQELEYRYGDSFHPLLHDVFRRGMGRLGEALMKYGCSPNTKDKNGQTALFHVETREDVERLLAAGIDPLILDDKGLDAVTHWKRNPVLAQKSKSWIKLLKNHPEYGPEISHRLNCESARNDKPGTIARALASGVSSDQADQLLTSALSSVLKVWELNLLQGRQGQIKKSPKIKTLALLMNAGVGSLHVRQAVAVACIYMGKVLIGEIREDARKALVALGAEWSMKKEPFPLDTRKKMFQVWKDALPPTSVSFHGPFIQLLNLLAYASPKSNPNQWSDVTSFWCDSFNAEKNIACFTDVFSASAAILSPMSSPAPMSCPALPALKTWSGVCAMLKIVDSKAVFSGHRPLSEASRVAIEAILDAMTSLPPPDENQSKTLDYVLNYFEKYNPQMYKCFSTMRLERNLTINLDNASFDSTAPRARI